MGVTKPYKIYKVWGQCVSPNLIQFTEHLGPMSATKPYKSVMFGAMTVMGVTKPYTCIGFGARDVTKPYKFIGFGANGRHQTLHIYTVWGHGCHQTL